VLTERIADEFMTVEELVGMGRSPFTGWHGQLGESDRQMVQKALHLTGTADWAQRTLHTLSDGQAQKAMIARALAQDTPLMLLDEPTAHLDVANRIALLQLLRHLARTAQKAILITSHELEALLQVSDTLWLLHPDGTYSEGMPEELALQGFINRAFDTSQVYFNITSGSFSFHNEHLEPKLRLGGNSGGVYWTGLALQKAGIGFCTTEHRQDLPLLAVEAPPITETWQWHWKGRQSRQLGQMIHWLLQETF
jgi:iron complex transport system ATP-binding protein